MCSAAFIALMIHYDTLMSWTTEPLRLCKWSAKNKTASELLTCETLCRIGDGIQEHWK